MTQGWHSELQLLFFPSESGIRFGNSNIERLREIRSANILRVARLKDSQKRGKSCNDVSLFTSQSLVLFSQFHDFHDENSSFF